MAARLDPPTVVQITNRYLARMIDVITRYRGTVDEFQGDGILAFFGAPLAAEDDPERAVACAIAMQNAMDEVNAEQRRLGLPVLAMGIGLNMGEVIVGNIGSEQRTKYGAMGSAINTAYRIESYTVSGRFLSVPSCMPGCRMWWTCKGPSRCSSRVWSSRSRCTMSVGWRVHMMWHYRRAPRKS